MKMYLHLIAQRIKSHTLAFKKSQSKYIGYYYRYACLNKGKYVLN